MSKHERRGVENEQPKSNPLIMAMAASNMARDGRIEEAEAIFTQCLEMAGDQLTTVGVVCQRADTWDQLSWRRPELRDKALIDYGIGMGILSTMNGEPDVEAARQAMDMLRKRLSRPPTPFNAGSAERKISDEDSTGRLIGKWPVTHELAETISPIYKDEPPIGDEADTSEFEHLLDEKEIILPELPEAGDFGWEPGAPGATWRKRNPNW